MWYLELFGGGEWTRVQQHVAASYALSAIRENRVRAVFVCKAGAISVRRGG